MEFGIFLNGYIPGPAAHQTELEHTMLFREAEYVIFADKHNWKYAWFGEHHALTEYSHMSAPEVVMGYIAVADRLHPPLARASTASRRARSTRCATPSVPPCSTTSPTTASSGAPVAAPASHEIATFNILDKNSTKAEWEEVVQEIPRMWEQVDYSYEGEHFTVPTPHNVLPEAVRQGSPADLGRVWQPADVHPRRRARHRRDRVQLRADLQPARPHRGLQGGDRELHRARSGSSRTTT